MIELRMTFETAEDAVAFLAGASLPTVAESTDAPKKRGRKGAKAETATDSAGAGAAAADPLAGILGNQQNPMQQIQPAVAAVLQKPAEPISHLGPPAPPQAVEFKDLIERFTALGKAKGRDAIAGVLAEFGATALPDIKKEQWALAVARVNQVLAA